MSVKNILNVAEVVLEAQTIGVDQQMTVSTDLMIDVGKLLHDTANRIRLLGESQSKTQAEIGRLNEHIEDLNTDLAMLNWYRGQHVQQNAKIDLLEARLKVLQDAVTHEEIIGCDVIFTHESLIKSALLGDEVES